LVTDDIVEPESQAGMAASSYAPDLERRRATATSLRPK
jgi:hypothetical protein